MTPILPGGKYSIPLSALYGETEFGLVIQVLYSKRTLIATLSTLQEQVGCHILYLEPLKSSDCGYCFFMEIISQVRNVYREDNYDSSSTYHSPDHSETHGASYSRNHHHRPPDDSGIDTKILDHASKYQIRLYPGFVFENALPLRLQYKVEVNDGDPDSASGLPKLVCTTNRIPLIIIVDICKSSYIGGLSVDEANRNIFK